MCARNPLDCLRSIRLAFIQCARYDAVPDAALQSHVLDPSLADWLLNLETGSRSQGQNLTQLCMATGLLMYLSNRRIQSMSVARLRAALLQQVEDACGATVSPHIACCYGVIASVLLQTSGAHQAALPLQRCLMAALTGYIYEQVSRSRPESPPLAPYSNSILAAFTSCVLEAQQAKDLCQIMGPLLHMLRSWCVPSQGRLEAALSTEARAVLQRHVASLATQLLQRLQQICSQRSTGRSIEQPTQVQPAAAKSPTAASELLQQGDSCDVDGHACKQPSCSEAAADVALLLAMAYHETSRANVPNLPRCVSQTLRLLKEDPGSTLLLARRIPSPAHLQHIQHKMCKETLFDERRHAAGMSVTDEACLGFAEHLQHNLRDHLLPALQSPGHWEDSAKFILTLLQACMPHKHGQNSFCVSDREEGVLFWWCELIQEILQILAVLTVSCAGSRKASLELSAAILSSCPDACPMKQQLCFELTGLLVISSIDVSVWPDLSKFMQAVALFCECPAAIRDVCQMCTVVSSKAETVSAACGTAIALVWVGVCSDPGVLPDVLQMADVLLTNVHNKTMMRTCLAEIRSALNKCHDCRKKPQCVRWFHRHVLLLAKL